MELKYRKLRCGKYKYETVGRFVIKTDLPNVKCNEYLSVVDGFMYIEDAYRWDGSSGPAIDTAKCMIASLVHDAYYQMMRENCIQRNQWRTYADRQYHKICLEAGMWEFVAEYRYWAIVKFAGKYTYPQKEKNGKVFRIHSADGKTTRTVSKAAGFLLMAICLLSVTGCHNRKVTYTDPNGFSIEYLNQMIAGIENVEGVVVSTPNGWLILVGEVKIDTDSLQLWLPPYGMAKTVENGSQ